jgi:hypothetical protein
MLAVKPLLQFHQPFTGEVARAIDHRLQRGWALGERCTSASNASRKSCGVS